MIQTISIITNETKCFEISIENNFPPNHTFVFVWFNVIAAVNLGCSLLFNLQSLAAGN